MKSQIFVFVFMGLWACEPAEVQAHMARGAFVAFLFFEALTWIALLRRRSFPLPLGPLTGLVAIYAAPAGARGSTTAWVFGIAATSFALQWWLWRRQQS